MTSAKLFEPPPSPSGQTSYVHAPLPNGDRVQRTVYTLIRLYWLLLLHDFFQQDPTTMVVGGGVQALK